jgi:uroporphyrinogen decarboxylase
VVSIGFAVFERAWTLRGMENLLMDMYLHPAFVDELIERITDYNVVLINRALAYDTDCIRFGDDWGMQRGLIFGKKLWDRFIKPAYSRMFRLVKESGKDVMLHSCGDVKELFPDLIDMGLDIFNTFQPELMDPELMKREYGRHLTFYGGISTQRVLPFATPEEVKQNVREMIAKVGNGGGYIVAPTHSMPPDIPPANIAAFIEAVQNQ